jgi:hypothetical protein
VARWGKVEFWRKGEVSPFPPNINEWQTRHCQENEKNAFRCLAIGLFSLSHSPSLLLIFSLSLLFFDSLTWGILMDQNKNPHLQDRKSSAVAFTTAAIAMLFLAQIMASFVERTLFAFVGMALLYVPIPLIVLVPIVGVVIPVVVVSIAACGSKNYRAIVNGLIVGAICSFAVPYLIKLTSQTALNAIGMDQREIIKPSSPPDAIIVNCKEGCDWLHSDLFTAASVPIVVLRPGEKTIAYSRRPESACDTANGDIWDEFIVRAGYFDWCISKGDPGMYRRTVEIELNSRFDLGSAGRILGSQLKITEVASGANKLLTHWAAGSPDNGEPVGSVLLSGPPMKIGESFSSQKVIEQVLDVKLSHEENLGGKFDYAKSRTWALKRIHKNDSNEQRLAQILLGDLLRLDAFKNDPQILEAVKLDFDAQFLKDSRPQLGMLYDLSAEARQPYLPRIVDYLLKFDPSNRMGDKSNLFEFLKGTKGFDFSLLSQKAEVAFSSALEDYPHSSSMEELYNRNAHICNLLLVLAAANKSPEEERFFAVSKLSPERAAEVIGRCMFGYRPSDLRRFKWTQKSFNEMLKILSAMPLKPFGEFVHNNDLIESLDQQQLLQLQKAIDEVSARDNKREDFQFSAFDLEQAAKLIARRLDK